MGISITVVWLTSCLTGLDLTKQEDKYVANSMNTKQLNPKKINRTSALLRYLPLSQCFLVNVTKLFYVEQSLGIFLIFPP